jgi:hypothetical protein
MANRNPRNPGSFAPEDVPANGKTESRYLLPAGPAGWPTDSPGESVADTYRQLVEERMKAASPLTPDELTVELKYVRHDPEKGWQIVPRGSVTGRPTLEPIRPGRFARNPLTGGALLDDLMLGGASFTKARDDELWKALVDFLASARPRGRVVRLLNDLLGQVVCLRAGLEVKASALPQRHLDGT